MECCVQHSLLYSLIRKYEPIFLFLKNVICFLFSFSEEKKLSKYVSHRIQGNNVTLTVVFPEEGQYGMYFYSLFNIKICIFKKASCCIVYVVLIDSNVLGSSSIWKCRISNICFLQANAVENIKTNIRIVWIQDTMKKYNWLYFQFCALIFILYKNNLILYFILNSKLIPKTKDLFIKIRTRIVVTLLLLLYEFLWISL